MTQPTGVFVRLPLSADHEETGFEISERDCLNSAIAAIGTPVTGGELRVCGYEYEVKRQGCTEFSHDVGRSVSSINPAISGIEYRNISPLVSQSDAQAAIAALEAEVGRKDTRIAELEEELSGFRAGMSELIAKEVAALKGPEA